jgi:hypothetical protein
MVVSTDQWDRTSRTFWLRRGRHHEQQVPRHQGDPCDTNGYYHPTGMPFVLKCVLVKTTVRQEQDPATRCTVVDPGQTCTTLWLVSRDVDVFGVDDDALRNT